MAEQVTPNSVPSQKAVTTKNKNLSESTFLEF